MSGEDFDDQQTFADILGVSCRLRRYGCTRASEGAETGIDRHHDPVRGRGDPAVRAQQASRRQRNSSADKILLYVHGATYPAETAFDLPIEGVSMMDLIASRGYDVYLVDVRGYGHSTRPAEMSQPPEANRPIVSTKVAAHDLGVAVDYVLKKRKVSRIDVMGWSWGTSIAGLYTSEHNDKVNRLVLFAPLWIFVTNRRRRCAANAPPLGAYRLVSKASAKARWLQGRRRGQAGGFDSARRVRCLGQRHLGDRPRGLKT